MQRLLSWTRFLFEWRWAPCVGLVLGSLAFVALAVALIPERLSVTPGATQEGTLSGAVALDEQATGEVAQRPARKRRPKTVSRTPARAAPPPPPTSKVDSFFQAPAVELPPALDEPEPPEPPPPAPAPTEMTVAPEALAPPPEAEAPAPPEAEPEE